MRQVNKNAPQQAIKNLGRAYANFFEDLKKYQRGERAWKRVRVPKFKKKGVNDRFRADNGTDKQHPNAVQSEGGTAALPIAGWVKMREAVRFAASSRYGSEAPHTGRILSVTISRRADAWYASFSIEVECEARIRCEQTVVGVDLGITVLATLSDDTPRVCAPKPLRRYLQKLKYAESSPASAYRADGAGSGQETAAKPAA